MGYSSATPCTIPLKLKAILEKKVNAGQRLPLELDSARANTMGKGGLRRWDAPTCTSCVCGEHLCDYGTLTVHAWCWDLMVWSEVMEGKEWRGL